MVEIQVEVPDELYDPISAANAVRRAVCQLDLVISIESTIARCPGSGHWHIKKLGKSGTVEVTAIPNLPRLWVCYHDNRIGDGWVQEIAPRLATEIARCLSETEAVADLTGKQIIERCQSAYKSLNTYRGKTTVDSGTSANSTSASVNYVQPGKIRVDGTLAGSGTFAFVSNGSHTWEESSLTGGKWEKSASIDMAIAGFTGVSGMAATTIPAILTGGMWGNPFQVTVTRVSNETISGHPAYKLDSTNPLGNVTFWIDKKTFLLIRMHRIQNVPEMDLNQTTGAPPQPKANGKTTRLESTETYTDVRINEAIAASTFAKPKGAP